MYFPEMGNGQVAVCGVHCAESATPVRGVSPEKGGCTPRALPDFFTVLPSQRLSPWPPAGDARNNYGFHHNLPHAEGKKQHL